MKTLKMLFEGLEKKYKVFAFLAPVAMILEVSMEVFIPLIMSKIIDVGIANKDIAYTAKTGCLMIFCAILSLTGGVLSARFAAVGALGFARNIRRNIFSKVQSFGFSNIDTFSTPSLITRLTTDVTNLQNTYMMLIRTCVRAPIMLIFAAVMSFYLNKKLASIFLIVIPLLAILLGLIGTTAYPRFRKMFQKYDQLNADVQENLTAMRVVKAFVRQSHEKKQFENCAEDLRNTQMAAEKIVILNQPVMQVVMHVCIICMIWFGSGFIVKGEMQTGQLISFITYNNQILGSLMMLSMIFITMIISKASLTRIMEVLKTEPDMVEKINSSSPDITDNGSIIFKDVSFSYDGDVKNKVLEDINLEIPGGSTVGIIGGTGSSKTTLVQLIPRLYDVLSGSVEIGGVDVRDWPLENLRNTVAMVLQKNVLFSGTIRENLLWGNDGASENDIVECCKIACAHEFISSFPEGYETVLGQGGVNLSGGQKQRLCIARALLKKSSIIILDDSTSACDVATDKSIRQGLKTALKNTTTIIIAQRITSVQDADMILVMDKGRIVNIGNHEELLECSEIYREVYETQNR